MASSLVTENSQLHSLASVLALGREGWITVLSLNTRTHTHFPPEHYPNELTLHLHRLNSPQPPCLLLLSLLSANPPKPPFLFSTFSKVQAVILSRDKTLERSSLLRQQKGGALNTTLTLSPARRGSLQIDGLELQRGPRYGALLRVLQV